MERKKENKKSKIMKKKIVLLLLKISENLKEILEAQNYLFSVLGI
jgi:hypothetical protein